MTTVVSFVRVSRHLQHCSRSTKAKVLTQEGISKWKIINRIHPSALKIFTLTPMVKIVRNVRSLHLLSSFYFVNFDPVHYCIINKTQFLLQMLTSASSSGPAAMVRPVRPWPYQFSREKKWRRFDSN